MLDHFLWSVILAPALIVAVALPAVDRMPPARAAAVLSWSAVGVAVASTINLTLFTIKAFAQPPATESRLDASVSWLAVALLAASVVAVVRAFRGYRVALATASGFAVLPADRQVVVVDDALPEAYSIEGPPARIVVTTGMRDLLDPRQYQALLAHEREHLQGRHHRLVRMAGLAAAAHPLLRVLAARVGYLVERAADERAAAHVGDRHSVAFAIGAAALAGAGRGSGLHLAARQGVVPRRVRELLQPRTHRLRRGYLLLPVIPAVASLIWTVEATRDLVEVLHVAG
ncbi:M48 family metalloprotease [Winogradskya humida]|uniref:Membrane protein n=1 Tax=Winogradskya humida TaxID=113566 RepID=A0ABQ3ZHS4_9ACTN|nr:M48 family metalloprotease [Actinoplanes humidus]GIE18092.1 membrane protein [Actinoplanes humidus]